MDKIIERLDRVEGYIDGFDERIEALEEADEAQGEKIACIEKKIEKNDDLSYRKWERVDNKLDALGDLISRNQTITISLLGGLLVGIIGLCGVLVAKLF